MLKKVIKKIIKTFHIDVLLFKLTARHEILNVKKTEIKKAYDFLMNYSADSKNSCITQNKLNLKYDVQIIVPVYNAEKYLKECIDSVVKPSKKYTYCLTCINDGSIDSSGDILAEYNSSTVEIITQANKGFSGARNSGLENIKGKYIFFLDSDDYLDWSGIEKMLDVAFENDLDIVQGNHTVISENGEVKYITKQKEKTMDDATRIGFMGQPWAKIFKAQLFEKIKFPEDYWFEDSLMSAIIYHKSKKNMLISDNVYYHRDNSKGISRNAPRFSKCVDSFWITQQLYDDRKALELENNQSYYEYILHMVELTFKRTRYQSEDVKKSIFILFADFIKKNFPDFDVQGIRYKILRKAVYNMDYGYYKKCCEYFLFEF